MRESSAAEGPDLIPCDLEMPGLTGPQVYLRLAEEVPELTARVVFMSGGTYTAENEALLETSGVPLLAKPFSLEEVFEVAEMLLGEVASG